MAKDLQMTLLFDFYGELLTEKQNLAMDLYYNQDLSLAEIAEPLGISRQGVRDFIVRGEKQLAAFEEKLGLVKRFHLLKDELERVQGDVSTLIRSMQQRLDAPAFSESLTEIQEALSHIVNDL